MQRETLASKQRKAGKKPKLHCLLTYEPLKTTYEEQNKRNKIAPRMGDNVVRLVHDFVRKNKLESKDRNYRPLRHPDFRRVTRSQSLLSFE